MEFDFIIGQPPYIDKETGKVVYWDFFEQAKKLGPKKIAMMSSHNDFDICEALLFGDNIKIIEEGEESCYFLWIKDDED